MPICRRSASRAGAALFLLAVSAAAGAQGAQPPLGAPPAEVPAPTSAGARDAIGGEGDAAMERLRSGIAGQTDAGPAIGPSAIPVPDREMRRRAFDAMRRHASAPALEERARQALKAGEKALAAEREAMARRLGQALGLEAPDVRAIAGTAGPGKKPGSWVPLLFVSSSMPVATLRTYAGQLERARGVIAFRGMPGGLNKVAPMAKLSAEILRVDPGCEGPACPMRGVQLIVDPILFRQLGVTQVPALAMIPGDPTQPYCERDDDASAPRGSHIIYGDAALSGLLEEYARLGGREEVRDAQARLGNR